MTRIVASQIAQSTARKKKAANFLPEERQPQPIC